MAKRPRDEAPPCAAASLPAVRTLARAAAANAPDPHYLDDIPGRSPLLTTRQREKVVKYINELAEDFELCVQTGGLACNYFDRYVSSLSDVDVAPSDKRLVQMIASTCLLMAAKFFDRKLPPLSELEKVHHGRVDASEFAALELRILRSLRWRLHVPLPHAFTDHLLRLCAASAGGSAGCGGGPPPFDATIEDRMLFFIDLSVYGYHFLRYDAPTIAAAALVTGWKLSHEEGAVRRFLPVLAHACELEPQQLSSCVNALVLYYQTCFPEAAKSASQASLFIPIPHEASKSEAATDDEREDNAKTPVWRPPTPAPAASATPLPSVSPCPSASASEGGPSPSESADLRPARRLSEESLYCDDGAVLPPPAKRPASAGAVRADVITPDSVMDAPVSQELL